MGARAHMMPRLGQIAGENVHLGYVGRPERASPSEGYPVTHAMEQSRILKTALGILSGNYLVIAHVDALADAGKVKIIGEYLGLLQRAYGWAAAHQDQWAALVAQEIGVPLAYVQDGLGGKGVNQAICPPNDPYTGAAVYAGTSHTIEGKTDTLTVTCPSNAAQVGVAYNSSVVATGGTPPYTFSMAGLLPQGRCPLPLRLQQRL